MITRRTLLACSLARLLMLPSVARTQSNAEATHTQDSIQGGILDVLEQMRQGQAQQLEGSWTVTVTLVVLPGVP